MKKLKKEFPKPITNNENPADQSKATPMENRITGKGTGSGNEKRKATWWEKWTVFTAIISIFMAIWSLFYAYEGNKIADLSLQKSDESNNISKKANKLAKESNKIAEQTKKVSEEANKLAKESNKIAEQTKKVSEKANKLAKESNEIATKSAAAAEEAVRESREMRKIAIDANNITDTFNRIQYNIQRANLLKEGKELFENEKAVCCRKIIEIFNGYFYVMSDLSQEKMEQFLNWHFDSISKEKEDHIKFIGISDKDEEYILKSFLMQINDQCNPKKNGIANTAEAIEYYLKNIQDYHNMVALYDMNSKIDQYSLLPNISDKEYFINIHLNKDIMIMLYNILPNELTNDWNVRFNILLKDKNKYRTSLLKERDNNKKLYYKKMQSIKPSLFTKVPAFKFWKSMIAFSEKNDSRILKK